MAKEPFYYLKCIGCGKEYSPKKIIYTCTICEDLLSVEYAKSDLL